MDDESTCHNCIGFGYYIALFEWVAFGASGMFFLAASVTFAIFLLAGVVYSIICALVFLQGLFQQRVKEIFKRQLAEEFIVACLDVEEGIHPPPLQSTADVEAGDGGGGDGAGAGAGAGGRRARAISAHERDFLIGVGLL